MKQTTYILIGILFSVLLVLVGGVIYVSMQKPDKGLYTLTFSDKMVKTELTDIRAIKLYVNDSRRLWVDGACVNVVPSADGMIRISNPESKYLKVTQKADTLVICLDLSKYNLPKQNRDYITPGMLAEGLQITIEAGGNLAFLANDIPGITNKLSGMHLDSLVACTRGGSLQLDSCSMQTLRVDGENVTFSASKSTIPHLYLDLDGVNNWTVNECNIDTEHLTGSGKHQNHLQKGECKQVLWTPKVKDAELSVTFTEKGRVTLQ